MRYDANVYYHDLSGDSIRYWTTADSIRQIINTVLRSGGTPYYLTIVDTGNGEQVPPHHVGYLLRLLDRKINK